MWWRWTPKIRSRWPLSRDPTPELEGNVTHLCFYFIAKISHFSWISWDGSRGNERDEIPYNPSNGCCRFGESSFLMIYSFTNFVLEVEIKWSRINSLYCWRWWDSLVREGVVGECEGLCEKSIESLCLFVWEFFGCLRVRLVEIVFRFCDWLIFATERPLFHLPKMAWKCSWRVAALIEDMKRRLTFVRWVRHCVPSLPSCFFF